MNSEQELVFAKLLVGRGLASADALKDCLRAQSELANQGREAPLAAIVLERGLVQRATLDQIVSDFEAHVRSCETCGAYFYHPPDEPPATLCRRCSGYAARERGTDQTGQFRMARGAKSLPPRPPSGGVQTVSGGFAAAADTTAVFGDYEIIDTVARGGMGIVYKARHRTLGRIVALKVLREGRRSSDDHVRRFKREAQSVAKLQHPHIVRIHEFGHQDGQYFFTMDFIEGESFEKFLASPDRDMRRGVEIIRDVARAIDFAHKNGIIHRDLKPANILIDRSGRAQITDFGLARNVDHHSALTQDGELLGTPLYMAPEQVRGRVREVDARTDVYGLGVILYQHLAGQLPFLAQTMVELQWKVVNEEPPSLRHLNPVVDPALETIALKCLEKAREDRYQTASELADDLDLWLSGKKIQARAPSMPGRIFRKVKRNRAASVAAVAILLFVAAGGVAIGWVEWRERKRRAREERERVLSEIDGETAQLARAVGGLLEAARANLAAGSLDPAEANLRVALERLLAAENPRPRGLSAEELAPVFARHDLGALRREHLRLAARAAAAAGTPEALCRAKALLEELVARLPPDAPAVARAEVHVELARARRDLGEREAAEQAVAAALAIVPRFAPAERIRGELALETRRWADAEDALGAALEAGRALHASGAATPGEVATIQLGRAIARFHLGKDAEATEDLKAVKRASPTEARVHVYLGEIALRRGDKIGAGRHFDQAIELAPDSAEAYLYRGRFALREGDFARARDDLQLALDEDDHIAEAWLWHGVAMYHLASDPQAEERAEKELERAAEAPDLPPALRGEAWRWLGRLRRAAGRAAEAVAAYERAVALDGRDAAALVGLGRALLAVDRPADAQRAFAKALDAGPTPAAHVGLGLVALRIGAPEKALADFERALELSPRDQEALAGRARAREALGRTAAALADWQAALRASDEPPDVRWFLRQGKKLQGLAARSDVALDRATKLDQALHHFERAAALLPTHARAHIDRALVLERAGRLDQARAACDAAIAANRCAAEAYYLRGKIEAAAGTLAGLGRAIEDFGVAIDLGSRGHRARFDRAAAYARRGTREDLLAAQKDLETIAEHARDEKVFAALASVYMRLGDVERARRAEERQRSLEAAPRSKRAAERAAEAERLAATDVAGAIRLYGEAIADAPGDGTLYLRRAILHLQGADAASAIPDFARAIELRPALAESLYAYLHRLQLGGRALDLTASGAVDAAVGASQSIDGRSDGSRAFLRGFARVVKVESGQGEPVDEERGIAEFSAALEEDPTSAAACAFRGLLALRAGDLKSAKEDLRLAIILDGKCNVARVYMAGVHAQEGYFDLAFAYLKQAVEEGFTHWTQLGRDEALAPLKLDARWREMMKLKEGRQ